MWWRSGVRQHRSYRCLVPIARGSEVHQGTMERSGERECVCHASAHSSVLVAGCGSSSGMPSVRCLRGKKPCEVCLEAFSNPRSKNRRHNPSLLIRYYHGKIRARSSTAATKEGDESSSCLNSSDGGTSGEDGEEIATVDGYSYILIDCGKTFR